MMLNKLKGFSAFLFWATVPVTSVLAQPAKPVDPVMQQLVGQWQGTLSSSELSAINMSIGFMFAPSGKAIMFFPESTFPGRTQALVGAAIEYAIDAKPKPMHLDFKVVTFDKPVMTIFDLPNPQTLKLQIDGTNPGAPRPKQFKQEAQFHKTSDTAIVPLIQLAQAEQSKMGEGQWVMKSAMQSALLSRMTTNQFPNSLEQLGLSQPETKNYRFQLVNKPQQLTLIARSKNANFKSFVGVVVHQIAREKGKPQETGYAVVCQTFRPSLIAPPLPTVTEPSVSGWGRYAIECGSGSESMPFYP